MPFAVIRISCSPFCSCETFEIHVGKIQQQPEQGRRRSGRHEMPGGLDQLEAGAGNFLRQFLRAGRRPHGVVTAGHPQGGAFDLRQQVHHVGARQHAVPEPEADRIVGQIAAPIVLVGSAVGELRRIGFVERDREHAAHAVALGQIGALVEHAGAARIDARRRVAEHDRAHLLGVALHEAEHLRACGRHRHQMIGGRQVERRQHGLEIAHRIVVAELLAHLLGQALAALIVAQHPKALAQARRDPVPTVERSPQFMQQHHDRPLLAGQLIMDADAVRFLPRQGPVLLVCPARLANPSSGC